MARSDHQGRTPIDIATMHSEDPRVTESNQLLASLQHDRSLPTPEEVKESVKKIFQMSAHMAAELLSLPGERREYMTCREGTFYMPEDAVKKLNDLLQTLNGDEELLSEFETELSLVTTKLVEGKNTGQVLHKKTDEAEPKYFSDATEKLSSIMDTLESIRQVEPSSDIAEEATTKNMPK